MIFGSTSKQFQQYLVLTHNFAKGKSKPNALLELVTRTRICFNSDECSGSRRKEMIESVC